MRPLSWIRWPRKLRLPRPFPDVNHLLHHLRGRRFAEVPKGIVRLVSVGCAGTWYFHWIEDLCGPVRSHIGVEFYSPKPADLPEHVQWIANTAGEMPEVPDHAADAIFSGQNFEHLWPNEVVGFLTESHRILDTSGLLVIDSPNRSITSRLGWSHPEHTVEFTVPEIQRLCELAGFDVTCCAGIWLCEDPKTGRLLRFEEMARLGRLRMTQRSQLAESLPESSFIWWIEARKVDRKPQTEELRSAVDAIFSKAWPERCSRMQTIVGDQDGDWFDSRQREGVVMYGPYMPLRAGSYVVTFHLKCDPSQIRADTQLGKCDVVASESAKPLCISEIQYPHHDGPGRFSLPLHFSLPSTTFGVQFRVMGVRGVSLRVCRRVDIQPLGRDEADMWVCSLPLPQ